jgi:hypothetical protein
MVTTRSGRHTSPPRPRLVLVRQRRLQKPRVDELLQLLPVLVFFLSFAALVVLEANGLLLEELRVSPPAPKQQFWIEVLKWL